MLRSASLYGDGRDGSDLRFHRSIRFLGKWGGRRDVSKSADGLESNFIALRSLVDQGSMKQPGLCAAASVSARDLIFIESVGSKRFGAFSVRA